jgi:hypothetical protein
MYVIEMNLDWAAEWAVGGLTIHAGCCGIFDCDRK